MEKNILLSKMTSKFHTNVRKVFVMNQSKSQNILIEFTTMHLKFVRTTM